MADSGAWLCRAAPLQEAPKRIILACVWQRTERSAQADNNALATGALVGESGRNALSAEVALERVNRVGAGYAQNY